jgi:hypothetical protein
MLGRAIDQRRSSWDSRIKAGIVTKETAAVLDEVFAKFSILLIVNSDHERDTVKGILADGPLSYRVDILSLGDVDFVLRSLGGALV